MLRGKYQIISVILVVIIASQLIAYNNISGIKDEDNSGNFMLVEIEHRNSEGVLLETRCIEDDLILRNFAYWLINQNSGLDATDMSITYKPKNMLGALVDNLVNFDMTPTSSYVYIGTGTTAPTITDYILENQVMGERITDRLYWSLGTQFNITIDCLFLIDGSYAITEIGMSTTLESDNVLMVRDTFPAINVNAGDTLTTRYFLLANWGG